MKYLLVIMSMLSSWTTYAQEVFPSGCVPFVVRGELATLSTEKPLIVMIHNLSSAELWITHPVTDAGAQAGWSSRLESGKWSALALNSQTKKFKLSCIESKPGHEQQIPCSDVLAVCQWPNTQMPEEKTGTFWAGENMDMLPLKAYIERLGFVLEPPKAE
ncbi:MAG: hypothetical protein Q8R24_06800 [Legionellaceae bacterium]|nr:hypothetical protein [Legionellaceae bacterium]